MHDTSDHEPFLPQKDKVVVRGPLNEVQAASV
jgi:hypothetical protein